MAVLGGVVCLLSSCLSPRYIPPNGIPQALPCCERTTHYLAPRCAEHADCKYSFVGFSIVTPIFLAWVLTFSLGYDAVFSDDFLERFDATRLNLRTVGWAF